MSPLEESVFRKLIGMFTPNDGGFLDFKAGEVIDGPNDRSLIGFDNHFPKEWLIEDFGFTDEEADYLIRAVHETAVQS